MKLLWIFMLFLWTSFALSDEVADEKDYVEELSFEYDVTDGKLSAYGNLVTRESDRSETKFLPDYIPSDITNLCITGDPEFAPCLSPEAVPQELKEPKSFSFLYYMWVSPTRAAIGSYASRMRKQVELRDSDLEAFKSLKILIFHNTGLAAIESNVFDDLTQMEIIQIDSNNLTKLSRKIFSDVPHLKTLSLLDNDISNVELGSFDKLNRLTELFLGHNRLDALNLDLFYSLRVTLEVLKVNNNRISKVDIKHLEANSFQVSKQVPAGEFLPQMVELRILDLQGNQLSILDALWLSQVPNLEELNLADNQIKFLENDAFAITKKLRILNLSNNRLKIPQAAWYKALKSRDNDGPWQIQYHGNEWECNCNILEYHNFFEKEREQIEKLHKEDEGKMTILDLEITCFQPASLYGKLLNNETVKVINKLFGCKTDDEEIQDNTEEVASEKNDDEERKGKIDGKASGKNDEDVERQVNTANEAHQANTETMPSQYKAIRIAKLRSQHSKTVSFQFDIDPDLYPYITALVSLLIVCITACYFKPRYIERQSPMHNAETNTQIPVNSAQQAVN